MVDRRRGNTETSVGRVEQCYTTDRQTDPPVRRCWLLARRRNLSTTTKRLPSHLRYNHPRMCVFSYARMTRIFFDPVTLTLTRWPSYTNMTRIPWRNTHRPKLNCLGF